MTIFILSKLDVVIYCFKAARKPSYKCRYFVEELRNEQPTDFVITCSFLFGCYGLFLFFFPDVKASKCLLVKHIDLYRFCSVVANVITYFRVYLLFFSSSLILSLKFRQTVIQFSSHFPCECYVRHCIRANSIWKLTSTS